MRALSDEDWRSEERYAGLGALSPTDLAWEFLRRNPAYQHEFRTWIKAGSDEAERADFAPWARWGLSFRRRSRSLRVRPTGPLAA
ncbi:transcriptional regulator domain-containing protein [Phenylobacterium soli]|uniref:transcriptional regulator domain-containing protein n=1 Tax=Phenylobacterium soli TaxID=2170551 RepID=UPI001D0377A7